VATTANDMGFHLRLVDVCLSSELGPADRLGRLASVVLRTRQKDVGVLMQSHEQHVFVRVARNTDERDTEPSATEAGDVRQSHEPLTSPNQRRSW